MVKLQLMNKKKSVKKSNNLIESRCNLSLRQQKLILSVISQINRGDDEFKEYLLSISEFKQLMEIKTTSYYTELRKAAEELVSKKLIIPRGERRVLITTWFSSIEIDYEGQIGFMFDIKLKPYLLNLKSQFTAYQIKNILLLKSKYSIRLYELLKQYQSLKCRGFELKEFRELLYVEPEKYTRFSDFKKRVLESSKKDINKNTDIQISYTLKKTGRYITGIEFSVVSQGPGQKQTKPVPSKILNMIPKPERAACMNTTQAVFNEHGEEGLIFYLEKCNARKKTQNGNYAGYLNTIIDLDLWPVEKATREIQAGSDNVKAQLERAKVEADLKAQALEAERNAGIEAEKKHLQELVNFVDLEALDAFIQSQELNKSEARLFKENKRTSLRTKFINSFIAKK